MIQQNASCDPAIHQLAISVARKCRHVIQACLREEEWIEADRCFYEIIREALEGMKGGDGHGR